MDEPQISFGDKIFLYGQFMEQERWDEYGFCNPVYNSVMGYIPNGGYLIHPQKTEIPGACLPGFVVDFLSESSLALRAPFVADWIDVTEDLALQTPYFMGCRTWMPVIALGFQIHPDAQSQP